MQDHQLEENESAEDFHELDFHDRWVWVSKWIVEAGLFLGFVAKLMLGRKFIPEGPIIGRLLTTFSVVWAIAFFHLLYTHLRGRLSTFVKWLCLATIALFSVIIIWAILSGNTQLPKNPTNGKQEMLEKGQP